MRVGLSVFECVEGPRTPQHPKTLKNPNKLMKQIASESYAIFKLYHFMYEISEIVA